MTSPVLGNRISLNISDADMQIIQAAVKALEDTLLPHLVDLGPDDRSSLTSMGPKSVDFVSKTLSYTLANAPLVQAFVDVDEFQRDFASVGILRDLQQPLTKIAHMVDSSLVLAGSEAYAAARACYGLFKSARALSLPGAVSMTEDLSEQFASRTSAKVAAPAPAPAPSTPAIKGSIAPLAPFATVH